MFRLNGVGYLLFISVWSFYLSTIIIFGRFGVVIYTFVKIAYSIEFFFGDNGIDDCTTSFRDTGIWFELLLPLFCDILVDKFPSADKLFKAPFYT